MGELLESIQNSMRELSEREETVFIGYNLAYGSRCYGTLNKVPDEKILEMPVAENLMTGIAIGMALEDYKPVLIFERHDFILLALDQLVNHLDKIHEISEGQFNPIVLIRAIVGATSPLDPGPQHSQDYTKQIVEMTKHIREFEIIEGISYTDRWERPVIFFEQREDY